MRIFVLGGTGSIGTGIVLELRDSPHETLALSRSEAADAHLLAMGATPVRGDLRDPEAWVHKAVTSDAVVHAAATFADDMAAVDERVVTALIAAASTVGTRCRMLYTGGCWLYGETGDRVATEDHPFDPLPAFAWMIDHGRRLSDAPAFSTAIVHPAMVYHSGGGVFRGFVEAAREGRPIEIWGSPQTRWPLVHRSDLARAYRLLLERPDLEGHFNVVSEQAVRVGEIVDTVARAVGSGLPSMVRSIEEVVAEHGAWARGHALDQQMSAARLRSQTGWAPQFTDYRHWVLP